MPSLSDLLSKLKVNQETLASSCGPAMKQKLEERYVAAATDISGLETALQFLSGQLEKCLALWVTYATESESLSTTLAALEERARVDFKLQSSFEGKSQQAIAAMVCH